MKTGENKIDQLFRVKLEGSEYDPSSVAKERMEHIIVHRRNKVIYRRLAIAAGLLVQHFS